MTNLIETLYLVKYSPFRYGEFMASFYSELRGVEHNLLLSQLVIPLCSHPVLTMKIEKSNKRSSVWSFFDVKNKEYDARDELHNLQERIDLFRSLTNESLQYCLANDWLDIETESLNVVFSSSNESIFRREKSAVNLGRLFSHHSVAEIYALLRVVPR